MEWYYLNQILDIEFISSNGGILLAEKFYYVTGEIKKLDPPEQNREIKSGASPPNPMYESSFMDTQKK